ncbi:MFS transporter [Belliella marina]|uniref:MFS transporter n=1 Tax=Belliella marina TaxID=1644146 RepID=UPI003671152A
MIYAIVLADMTASSIILPILPQLVEGSKNPQIILALGTALFLGIQVFTVLIFGKMSDFYGRKPIFLLSAVGTFFANTILLFQTPLSFLANRASDGLTNGAIGVVKSSITEISPSNKLQRNMGLAGSVFSIGFIVGPLLSGGLILLLNLEGKDAITPLIFLALSIAIINITLSLIFKETLIQTERARGSIYQIIQEKLNFRDAFGSLNRLQSTNEKAFKLILIQFFLTLSLGHYHYFIIFIGLGELKMNAKEISQFFIFMGIVNILTNYIFFTKLVNKVQPIKFIVIIAILSIITHIGYANIGSSKPLLYSILVFDCLTISLLPGIVDILLAEETKPNNRGEIFGYSQLFVSFADILTTVVFGLLSLFSFNLPFYWFAICLAPLTLTNRWLK